MSLAPGTRLGPYDIVADVPAGAEFHAGAPRQVLAVPKDAVWVQPTLDFQRFLVSLPVAETTTSTLTLVFDWVGALRKQ